jgi:hypothetical protein
MDRIHWIPEVVNNWQGPISLAVFIAAPDEWIGLNLLVNFYRKCNPLFRDYVSIHVVVPSAVDTFDSYGDANANNEAAAFLELYHHIDKCELIQNFTKATVERFKAGVEAKDVMAYYPQNHMRNIARKVSFHIHEEIHDVWVPKSLRFV